MSTKKSSTIKKTTYADMARYRDYATIVKSTKKSQKKKAQKIVPWTLAKSVVKFKRPITKKRQLISKQKSKMKLQNKLEKELKKKFTMRLKQDSPTMPNIYLIIAHSSECYINDIDNIIDSGTLKPIKILEKAAKKYTKHSKQFMKDAESLRNFERNERCHRYYKNHDWHHDKDIIENPNISPYKDSVYFCEQCLKDSASNKYCKYFWCESCAQHHFQDSSKELHKPIKIDTRILLDYPFKYNNFYFPKGRLKVLMGQSSGRKGFMSTYYKIIEQITDGYPEDNEFLKLLFDIIDTDRSATSKIDNQMKQLNKTLNNINSKYKHFQYHNDKIDTDFRLYPRINKKKINGKTTKRLIHGPHDFELSFEINKSSKGKKNGDTWPLGVYNLKNLSRITYNMYFMNNWADTGDFFNIIKDSSKYKIFPKSLLLKVDKPKHDKEYQYNKICKSLDINPTTGLHNGKINPFAINRYNVNLYNKHFVPKRTPIIKLSELMKLVLEQDGYLQDKDNKKPEAIFITNICRGVLDEGELTHRVDHTRNTTPVKGTNTTISEFHRTMRENSNEA